MKRLVPGLYDRLQLAPLSASVCEAGGFLGLVAPAGTPREILDKLTAEINRITALPETKERLDAAGMERFALTRPQFVERLRADYEKFGRIIKTADVKL